MLSPLLFTAIAARLPGCEVGPSCRCHPEDPCWPSAKAWAKLNATVDGQLLVPESPVSACLGDNDPTSDACQAQLRTLTEDPFLLQENPGATQTMGELGGWTAGVSEYAVSATKEEHIVEAVNFARTNNLRLVVKGTGHDYYGRSSAPNSLLIWTRNMRDIEFHDEYVPACDATSDPIAAVTVEAGCQWMDVYAQASARNLYVQGGGCTSVGVVGWTIGGGAGSFSKYFGTGPANLLEARVVTAEGEVVVANKCSHPNLYWAMRGGGFGFGVVVSLTFRTHPSPKYLGVVSMQIYAGEENDMVDLVSEFLGFYNDRLSGPYFGEQFEIHAKNTTFGQQYYTLGMALTVIDHSADEVYEIWKPFYDFLEENANRYYVTYTIPPNGIATIAGNQFWNASNPLIAAQTTPSAHDPTNSDAFIWTTNQGEIARYNIHYLSRYMTQEDWFEGDLKAKAKKLIDLSNDVMGYSVHTNKGQYNASAWALEELANTPQHPSIFKSPALLITGTTINHYTPLVPDSAQESTSDILAYETNCKEHWDVDDWKECPMWDWQAKVFQDLRDATPGAGAYFNEADFQEPSWQDAFWGAKNYERLLKAKKKWDPYGLFCCHNCVGSEMWDSDCMCRKCADAQ